MQVDAMVSMAKTRKRSESTSPASAAPPESSWNTTPGAAQDTAAASPSQSGAQSESSAPQQSEYSPQTGDSRYRIAQRAYELYLSRGGRDGSDWEDWLQAERELVTNRED
jgi:hypothetical protein